MRLVKETTGLGGRLAEQLRAALLVHSKVIWLVPGGSNIAISVEAMRLIDPEMTRKLVIMQTDERFVPTTSTDCNWRQLARAGFDTKYATTYPILIDGEDRDTTVSRYAAVVAREFAAADYIFGQFGIGPDGHIAGIKPHSPACTSHELVAGYQGEDFNRVTLTFLAFNQLDSADAFVFGDSKQPVLKRLLTDSPPLSEFPAGIVRLIPECTVYNDQIKESGW